MTPPCLGPQLTGSGINAVIAFGIAADKMFGLISGEEGSDALSLAPTDQVQPP